MPFAIPFIIDAFVALCQAVATVVAIATAVVIGKQIIDDVNDTVDSITQGNVLDEAESEESTDEVDEALQGVGSAMAAIVAAQLCDIINTAIDDISTINVDNEGSTIEQFSTVEPEPYIETFPSSDTLDIPNIETFPSGDVLDIPNIETFPADDFDKTNIEVFPMPDSKSIDDLTLNIDEQESELDSLRERGEPYPNHKVEEDTSKRKLPAKGEANTSTDLLNPDGTVKQRRYYGPDGKAKEDIDYNHTDDGTHTFPHRHKWDWSKKPPRLDSRNIK